MTRKPETENDSDCDVLLRFHFFLDSVTVSQIDGNFFVEHQNRH